MPSYNYGYDNDPIDYTSALKRRRMFDPSSQQDPTTNYRSMLDEAPPSEKIISSLEASRPRREDYKQNTFAKILTAIIGASMARKDPAAGVAFAQKMRDEPYERARSIYNEDADRQLQQARIADAAFGRKLRGAEFDVREQRRTEDLELERERNAEAGRKNAAAEQLAAQKFALEKRAKEAQMAGDHARANLLRKQAEKLDESSGMFNLPGAGSMMSFFGGDMDGLGGEEDDPSAGSVLKDLEAEQKIRDIVGQDILRELSGGAGFKDLITEDPNDSTKLTSSDPRVIAEVKRIYEQRKPRFRRIR